MTKTMNKCIDMTPNQKTRQKSQLKTSSNEPGGEEPIRAHLIEPCKEATTDMDKG